MKTLFNTLFTLALVTAFLAVMATPAEAAGIGQIVMAIGTAFKTAAAATGLAGIAVRVGVALVSHGLSLLQQRKAQRDARYTGFATLQTTKGGTDPQGTVAGFAPTGGHVVYRNSHGPKNRFYTVVIEVSDLPGLTLDRLIIDNEYSDLGPETDPDYGLVIETKRTKKGTPRGWIRYYDGSQVAADPMLVAKYGTDEERPWTADHVLPGICYAILTFRMDRKVYQAEPQVRFQLKNLPFYDPREDSSVGGDGPQRFDDPATWQPSLNPIVASYTIMRGYPLPDGDVWGGDAEAEDLPLASWVAAMNACDAPVGTPARPRFRFGLEIRFTEEPARVVEELLAAATAQIAEVGGVFHVQVAEPAPALVTIQDSDILVSEPQERSPFPSSDEVHNAIQVVFPSPGALWQPRALPMVTNAEWEAEDGQRRSISVDLPAVPFARQAAQIADSLIKDERRWVRHKIVLPPEYHWLKPLDTIAWTSGWNGYTGVLFEVAEVQYDLQRLLVTCSLRARDPGDLGHVEAIDLDEPPGVTVPVIRLPAPVPGFALAGVVLASGSRQRPAIRASWDADELGDVDGVSLELYQGSTLVWSATVVDVEAGEQMIEPVIPGAAYTGRARVITPARDDDWSDPVAVTAPDVLLGGADIVPALVADIADGAQAAVDLALLKGGFTGTLEGLEIDYQAVTEAAEATEQALEAAQQAQGLAEASATSANTDAASAATASAVAVDLARNTLPPTFVEDDRWWAGTWGGLPGAMPDVSARVSFTTVDSQRVARIATPISGSDFPTICHRGWVPWVQGRRWRITVRARRVGTVATSGSDIALFFRILNADGTVHATQGFTGFTLTEAWADYTVEVVATGSRPFMRAGMYRYATATGAGVVEVMSILTEDITESAAAATSASAAAASQTAAGQFASAAQQDATTANTAAAQASTAATQSSAAATTATGAAAEAVAARNVAAQVVSDGGNTNPVFAKGSGNAFSGYGWQASGGSSIVADTSAAAVYGRAVLLGTAATPTSAHPFIYWDEPRVGELVEIEAEVELVSGSWGGARLEARWVTPASQSHVVRVVIASQPEVPAIGQRTTLRFTVPRPTTWPQGETGGFFRMYVWGTSLDGDGYQPNVIRLHRMQHRWRVESFVRETARAVATAGSASAYYGLQVGTENGSTATMQFAAFSDGGNPWSKIRFDANEVEIDGDLLVTGTITEGAMADNAVTNYHEQLWVNATFVPFQGWSGASALAVNGSGYGTIGFATAMAGTSPFAWANGRALIGVVIDGFVDTPAANAINGQAQWELKLGSATGDSRHGSFVLTDSAFSIRDALLWNEGNVFGRSWQLNLRVFGAPSALTITRFGFRVLKPTR